MFFSNEVLSCSWTTKKCTTVMTKQAVCEQLCSLLPIPHTFPRSFIRNPLNFHRHKARQQYEDKVEQHRNNHYSQQVQGEKNKVEEAYLELNVKGWMGTCVHLL